MVTNRYPIVFTNGLFLSLLLMMGFLMVSCSSTPSPQPELSKEEIRQDADRFFHKMGQEEESQSPSKMK